jgi:hypothetical protein
MAKLPKLAAALTAQDTRLADVLRLSVIEGLAISRHRAAPAAVAQDVRKLLERAAERTPLPSELRASVLPVKLVPTITDGNNRRVRRRPGRRIRGVGDVTDLRRVRLVPDDNQP